MKTNTHKHIERCLRNAIRCVLLPAIEANTAQAAGHVHDDLSLAFLQVGQVNLGDQGWSSDIRLKRIHEAQHSHTECEVIPFGLNNIKIGSMNGTDAESQIKIYTHHCCIVDQIIKTMYIEDVLHQGQGSMNGFWIGDIQLVDVKISDGYAFQCLQVRCGCRVPTGRNYDV